MCNRRLVSTDGPDHVSYEFIHYRQCLRLNSSGIMDSQRIFHVSIFIAACGRRLTTTALQQLDSSCMEGYQIFGLAR
jgi:hypothetical protein